MSEPTREQIIEGRDEALVHLGYDVPVWDRWDATRRRRSLEAVFNTELDRAAALTIAVAECGFAAANPVEFLKWHYVRLRLMFTPPARQSDYALQA